MGLIACLVMGFSLCQNTISQSLFLSCRPSDVHFLPKGTGKVLLLNKRSGSVGQKTFDSLSCQSGIK